MDRLADMIPFPANRLPVYCAIVTLYGKGALETCTVCHFCCKSNGRTFIFTQSPPDRRRSDKSSASSEWIGALPPGDGAKETSEGGSPAKVVAQLWRTRPP
jgi:hypothetical protein